MADNIGTAKAAIEIDTSSVEAAVATVRKAASEIGRMLASIDDIVKNTEASNLRAAADLARGQAALMKATTAQMLAEEKIRTNKLKEEYRERAAAERDASKDASKADKHKVYQVPDMTDKEVEKYNKGIQKYYDDIERAQEKAARDAEKEADRTIQIQRDLTKQQEDEANKAIERADRVVAQKRQILDKETKDREDAIKKQNAEDMKGFQKTIEDYNKMVISMSTTGRMPVNAPGANDIYGGLVSDKSVDATIEAADRKLKAKQDALDKETAAQLAASQEQARIVKEQMDAEIAAFNKKAEYIATNGKKPPPVTANNALYGSEVMDDRAVDAAIERANRAVEQERQKLQQEMATKQSAGGLNTLFAPGMDDGAAAAQSLAAQRQKYIDQMHEDAIRMDKERDAFIKAQKLEVRKETGAQAGDSQEAISRAGKQLAILENEFKRIQAIAPPDISLDKLRGQLVEAKQPLLELQARLADLKTQLDTVGDDPAAIFALRNALVEVEREANQVAKSGLNPLKNSLNETNQQVIKATTGWNGFFNELREGLQEINRQGLGKNVQELAFRLSPAALVAGAAVKRGTETFESLEETRLSFKFLTGDMEKATKLMSDLTDEAHKFGLPVTDTLVTFQQYLPILEKTGHDFSEFVDLAARLATVNPVQGVEGGLRAISEAVSGSGSNFISLANRFNIPLKAVHKAIDDANGDTIKGLDNLLNSYSRTTELALAFGETTRAAFTRAQDAISQFLAAGVEPLLKLIAPIVKGFTTLLEEINKNATIIPKIVVGVMAVVAGFVAFLFVMGNVLIAFAALNKLYEIGAGRAIAFAAAQLGVAAATQTANAALTANAGAAGAATVAGGVAAATGGEAGAAASGLGLAVVKALGSLVATAFTAAAPAILITAGAVGVLAVVSQQATDAFNKMRTEALKPIEDQLHAINRAAYEATSDLPAAAPLGSLNQVFEDTAADIEETIAGIKTDLNNATAEMDNTRSKYGAGVIAYMQGLMGQLDPEALRTSLAGSLNTSGLSGDRMASAQGAINDMVTAFANQNADAMLEAFNKLPTKMQEDFVKSFGGPETFQRLTELANTTAEAIIRMNNALVVQRDALIANSLSYQKQLNAVEAFSQAQGAYIAGGSLKDFQEAMTALGTEIGPWKDALDEASKSLEKDEEQLRSMADAREKELQRQGEDRALDASRELFDFIQQRARATEDFWRQLAQEAEDFARDRQQRIDDFNKDIAEMEDDNREKRLKAQEDYDKELQRMQEDHQIAMARMARDVDDAISARDFLSAQKGLQKMADEEEDFQKELRRKQEDFDEQAKQLDEALEKQKKKKKDDFDRQLRDMDENFNRQRNRQIAEFQRRQLLEDQDRALRLARQAENYRIEDQRRTDDYNEQVTDLIAHNALMTFYMESGMVELSNRFRQYMQGLAAIVPSSGSGGNGGNGGNGGGGGGVGIGPGPGGGGGNNGFPSNPYPGMIYQDKNGTKWIWTPPIGWMEYRGTAAQNKSSGFGAASMPMVNSVISNALDQITDDPIGVRAIAGRLGTGMNMPEGPSLQGVGNGNPITVQVTANIDASNSNVNAQELATILEDQIVTSLTEKLEVMANNNYSGVQE